MRTKRAIGHLAVVFLIVSLAACYVVAQDDDDSKAIKAGVFLDGRPAKKSSTPDAPTVKKPANPGRYKPAAKSPKPTTSLTSGMVFARMGVTFWRLRKSTVADKDKQEVMPCFAFRPDVKYDLLPFKFRTAATKYQIIRDEQASVVVPYNEEAKALIAGQQSK